MQQIVNHRKTEPDNLPDAINQADALDPSEIFFTPTNFKNFKITLHEQMAGEKVTSSSLHIYVIGISDLPVACILLDNLPPDGAQHALETLLEEGEIDEQFVSSKKLEAVLKQTLKSGGTIYSDELGELPSGIVSSYRQVLQAMEQTEPAMKFLEKKQGISEIWDDFVDDLVGNVKDQSTLVWIQVELPPASNIAKIEEQRLDFIIKNYLMKQNSQVAKVLEEGWYQDKGTDYDLTLVSNLFRDNIRVKESNFLLLIHRGFVMTVSDKTAPMKDLVYAKLEESGVNTINSFVMSVFNACILEHHELVKKLQRVHDQLEEAVEQCGQESLANLEDKARNLFKSARTVFFACNDYDKKIRRLPEEFSAGNKADDRARVLEYAEDLLEDAQSLYDDSKALIETIRERISGRKESFVTKLGVISITTILSYNALTAPSAWREIIDPQNYAYMGVLGTISLLATYAAFKIWNKR